METNKRSDFSQFAIILALINAGVLSKEDIFNELERFTGTMKEINADDFLTIEPIRLLQDLIRCLLDEGDTLSMDFDLLFSSLTGVLKVYL